MSCIVVKLITSLPQGSREAQAIYLCLGVGKSVGAALAPPQSPASPEPMVYRYWSLESLYDLVLLSVFHTVGPKGLTFA